MRNYHNHIVFFLRRIILDWKVTDILKNIQEKECYIKYIIPFNYKNSRILKIEILIKKV